jgi:hypothetical protein
MSEWAQAVFGAFLGIIVLQNFNILRNQSLILNRLPRPG